MKKTISLVLAMCLCLCCLSGCGGQSSGKTDSRVDVALTALDDAWKDCKYEIKNTRIITIKETDIELFSDIDYIVEFILYTDYFGTAPYYCNAGIYDTVSVYKDGSAAVNKSDLFSLYRSRYYVTDYSDIIGEIKDLGSAYNN